MKLSRFAAIFALILAAAAPVRADQPTVVGGSTLGVNTTELKTVMNGWSAKHMIIGKAVYNDRGERIGTVDDVIIAPDKTASYGIIGVGGFLKMGTRDVAVPTSQITMDRDRVVIPGATKEALQQMPEFKYAKK